MTVNGNGKGPQTDITAVVSVLEGILNEVTAIDIEIAQLTRRRFELLQSAESAQRLSTMISNLGSARLAVKIDTLPARIPEMTTVWEEVKRACTANNILTLGKLADMSRPDLLKKKTLAEHIEEIQNVLEAHGLTLRY